MPNGEVEEILRAGGVPIALVVDADPLYASSMPMTTTTSWAARDSNPDLAG